VLLLLLRSPIAQRKEESATVALRPQRVARRPPVNEIQLRWPQGLRSTAVRKSGVGTGSGSGSAAGVSLRGSAASANANANTKSARGGTTVVADDGQQLQGEGKMHCHDEGD